MNAHSQQRGFTLLEMMLALALFSLLSLAGWQMVQGVLLGQQHISRYERTSSDMVRLFALLEQDLQHAFIPSGLDLVSQDAPFVAEDGDVVLRLVRRNRLALEPLPHSSLYTVEWRLKDGVLSRHTLSSEPGFRLDFPDIHAVSLRYSSAGHWQETWGARYALPDALEVSLSTPSWGPLNRLFILGNGV
ncbi:type II secretion system minor pseudopilin GspJ [Pantoea sp. LS15]|uniref:type II secretion system minor pseudopilin GspJ n=1 Tax=Enterobacterales TaxID=91347 RepID=UPI000E0F1720|nr:MULTISPECIES: type II secretion system minor pseudopilin GspJ [Enterobacterales]NJQ21834.1 type II secretion system minor pseudopilin GspJ [Pantoea sp. LS15]NKF48430.1 type II secretion system minor pseudopilin GspJ [Pantoea sp. LS15]RDK12984.1 type II secretion system protein GspJ [Enterobacter sp. 9-2]